MDTANFFVSSGLREKGYQFVYILISSSYLYLIMTGREVRSFILFVCFFILRSA